VTAAGVTPTTVAPGGTVAVANTVKNQGVTSTGASFTVAFFRTRIDEVRERSERGASAVEWVVIAAICVLAALAKRAVRSGYRGAARVVVAATAQRLVTLMHATGRIADAIVPTETVPAAPVPYTLATLRLGEADLEVVGLPLVEAYAPLWGLVLPGSAALARIELTASEALDTACSVAAVPMLEAGSLLREGDEADPEQVATLLRMLLEKALGG